MIFVCPSCKFRIETKGPIVWPFHCPCGKTYGENEKEKIDGVRCIHFGRGTDEFVECDGCGNPRYTLYECAVKTLCQPLMNPKRVKNPSRTDFQYCSTCDRFTDGSSDTAKPSVADKKQWSGGVTTTPSRDHRPTVDSARKAGFPTPKVFNDRLGNAAANWLGALASMFLTTDADILLILQDDAILSPDAKRRVEQFERIDEPAVLSLFSGVSPKVPENGSNFGWQLVKGIWGNGAVAYAITRPAAELILQKEDFWRHLSSENGHKLIDRTLDVICHRHGIPHFYHVPSLAQHVGFESTLDHRFVQSSTFLGKHTDSSDSGPKIGLVGWNTASGLGYVNRDIVANLDIRRWLIPKHPRFDEVEAPRDSVQVPWERPVTDPATRRALDSFLDEIDILLFFEMPYFQELIPMAGARGVRTVCVPMAEWLPIDPKRRTWPYWVDSFIAPTEDCHRLLTRASLNSRYVPWPVDLNRLEFVQRERCNKLVFGHGTGGAHDRKGGLIVAEAARMCPDVPLVVFTQTAKDRAVDAKSIDWPDWVDVRGSAADPREIYAAGDVYLAPSRFEGLGLPLIECQAAGLPLITTVGRPMDEYERWLSCQSSKSTVSIAHRQIDSYDSVPSELAKLMQYAIGRDISHLSRAARDFAEARTWQPVFEAITESVYHRARKMAV